MFIHFELKGGKRLNKGGTRTIRIYISHNDNAYYTTKYKVNPGLWDDKRSRLKDVAPNCTLWNGELIRLRNEVEALCLKHPSLPAHAIVSLIGKKSINTFPDFFENFIKDCESGKFKRSIGTIKNYRKVLNSIGQFEKRTDFDTIDRDWYDEYIDWLRKGDEEKKIKKKNENTIGGHIKIIKAVMREAFDRGVSTNIEFQKKYFKKPSQETDSIYLTLEEIALWENVDLSGFPHLQAERDRFLLSYYFLLRFSDSLNIGESDIFKENERYFVKSISIKTKTESIIPIKPKALDLLNKYGFKMPDITNQKANEDLKEIGALAKISNPTRLLGEVKPKSYFITSHTARRTAATHLYLEGFPLKDLSNLLGHKKTAQTEEYIKVSKLDSAKKALDFKFFK